ncbi:MAG: hypothetical protein AAGA75_02875 [Cyanobacteria bacterium P01_E01_bin.6]
MPLGKNNITSQCAQQAREGSDRIRSSFTTVSPNEMQQHVLGPWRVERQS